METKTGIYAVAALGLAALILALFAIVWPYNGADFDDWWNIRLSQSQNIHHDGASRQFNAGGTAIAQILMPDRISRIYYTNLLYLFGGSMGLFHIVFRLNRNRMAWLAFSVAAVNIAYIPYALDQVRALHVTNYHWSIFLATSSAVGLLEFLVRRGRIRYAFLLGSAIFGYMAIHAIEALIAPVVCIPILLLIVNPRLDRPSLWGLMGWGLVVGVATLQFVVPFVRGDAEVSYQRGLQSSPLSVTHLLNNTAEFYEAGFPVQDKILATEYDFVAPAILVTLIFLAGGGLLWLAFPEDRRLPPPMTIILMLVLGLMLTGLAGAAAIYADLHLLPRSHLIAMPGQALVVTAVMISGVFLAVRLMRLRESALLLMVGALFMFTASQWYVKAQVRADAYGLDMTINNDLWRDLKSLIPDTEPNTLILYYCPKPDHPGQTVRSSSLGAALLFYDQSRTKVAFWRFDVPPVDGDPQLVLAVDGIFYNEIVFTAPVTYDQVSHTYEEVIVVGCGPAGLNILETFPGEIAPHGAQTGPYNPFKRIREDFITGAEAMMLAR